MMNIHLSQQTCSLGPLAVPLYSQPYVPIFLDKAKTIKNPSIPVAKAGTVDRTMILWSFELISAAKQHAGSMKRSSTRGTVEQDTVFSSFKPLKHILELPRMLTTQLCHSFSSPLFCSNMSGWS